MRLTSSPRSVSQLSNNVGTLTSHNPTDLHGHGDSFNFFFNFYSCLVCKDYFSKFRNSLLRLAQPLQLVPKAAGSVNKTNFFQERVAVVLRVSGDI
jgi:hypothetical protein